MPCVVYSCSLDPPPVVFSYSLHQIGWFQVLTTWSHYVLVTCSHLMNQMMLNLKLI